MKTLKKEAVDSSKTKSFDNKNLYIVVAVIVVAALVLVFGNLTGKATYQSPKGCVDSDVSAEHDDGINYYTQGTVKYSNKDYTYTDYCFSRGTGPKKYINEYFCLAGAIRARNYNCDEEDMTCVNGACVK